MARSLNLGRNWPQECRAFVEHWNTVRGDTLVPPTETFLDSMSGRFASRLYITELMPTASVVRYLGTELAQRWGSDLTGQEILADRPAAVRARLRKIMAAVSGHPCGYFATSLFLSTNDRTHAASLVRLPLAVQPGRPARTVTYSEPEIGFVKDPAPIRRFETLESAWVDIGAGVPSEAPQGIRA